jgi:hypothetical protein
VHLGRVLDDDEPRLSHLDAELGAAVLAVVEQARLEGGIDPRSGDDAPAQVAAGLLELADLECDLAGREQPLRDERLLADGLREESLKD